MSTHEDAGAVARYSMIRTRWEDDQRARGRGTALEDVEGVHGTGAVPIGWSDCAWDYEQSQGYRRVIVGTQTEAGWARNDYTIEYWAPMDWSWSYDEVGVYPWDLSDEMEDELTGVSPPRHVNHRPCWDWTEDEIKVTTVEEERQKRDKYAEAYDLETAAAEEAAQRAHLVEEARARVRADAEAKARTEEDLAAYRLRPKMSRHAAFKVREHVESGAEGDFALEIVEGHQRLRWEYTIEDGVAYLTYKKIGWIPLAERR